MSRFFKRFFIFGLFTLATWLTLFLVFSQSYALEYKFVGQETNWGYVNQRSTEWSERVNESNDVWFFGSSTCYSGIDPHALQAFGFNGFNFCSSSQAITNSEYILGAATHHHDPAIIALDVYPSIWGTNGPGIESTKDWIINSNLRNPKWASAYRQLAMESGDIFTLITSFYYDFVRKFKAAGSNPHLAEDKNGSYRGLGFVARSFPPLDTISCETKERTMSERECQSILDMAELCSHYKARFILINPPQLCEEVFQMPPCFEGLSYIDGNNWPGAKTPQNFYDDHHLVEPGALAYSAWLAEQIASLTRD